MFNRNSIQVLIFIFAVVMVLLRPYAAYRISMNPNIAGDPVKVNSLLQRLIKKKDKYHTIADESMEAIVPAAAIKSLPSVLLLFIIQLIAFIPFDVKKYRQVTRDFQNYTRIRYYLSFSCIRL